MSRRIINILIGMFGFWIGTVSAVDNSTLPNKTDRLSYSMGVETGRSFKKHGLEVNPNLFAQGLRDGMADSPTLLSNDEIHRELQDLQRNSNSKMQTQMQQNAKKNRQLGNAFLSANKERPGVMTTASGLQYKIITPGNGVKPVDSDIVSVDYEGRLLDGKVFDSSYERGQPTTFPLNAVIAGWQEALKLMPEGSTWELYIPSELAYGEQGAQGAIGPNEVLIFKVHLISVQSQNRTQEKNTSTPPKQSA